MAEITLWQGDCLEEMKRIPDGSVDMVLCDLPYGITNCKWDKVIPFEPLWEQYKRICKTNAAIVLFGVEPFSSKLRLSAIDMFRYDWIWEKCHPVGFLEAKNRPMQNHECISVFSSAKFSNGTKTKMVYIPQGLQSFYKDYRNGKRGESIEEKNNCVYNMYSIKNKPYVQKFTNYPNTVLKFKKDNNHSCHPTQKPVALLEYLIRTYTNKEETVLDNAMGSGSTGVACVNTNRNFIGIELDEKYFEIAKNRIAEAEKSYTKPLFEDVG